MFVVLAWVLVALPRTFCAPVHSPVGVWCSMLQPIFLLSRRQSGFVLLFPLFGFVVHTLSSK